MARILLFYIVPIALAIYALADLVTFRDENPLGLPKGIWALIIIIFVLFGPIGWIVISRMSQPNRPPRGQRSPRYAPPPAPRAPDDDPEFLWRLAQQQRREREAAAEQEKKNSKKKPPTPEDPQSPTP